MQSPDPTLRSYLIDWLEPFSVDPRMLIPRLNLRQDASIKRAILLSLGEYKIDRLPLDKRRAVLPVLRQLYRDESDAGIHSAAGWLLRQWEMTTEIKSIDDELSTGNLEGQRQWYLNRQGQTLVVIPQPGEQSMGKQKDRHQFRIDRTYAIASTEVTVDQFQRFQKDHDYHMPFSPTADCPMNNVSWYDAAAYCNWLSDQDGLAKDQWCYEPNEDGEYLAGTKMASNFLQRSGYRLPTESEWEYSCRAGTNSTYSFGDSEELLGKYAWFIGNSSTKSHPVGSLQPNDLGLFEMHGNVWEWCQDAFGVFDDASAQKDQQQNLVVSDEAGRVLRGGSLNGQSSDVRSASRFNTIPIMGENSLGFRVARTLPRSE
jgi:formylglycine-generating enzyme required for sulfatase activity